jgi:ABC-type antimicrobial peptide transport system permease subunit
LAQLPNPDINLVVRSEEKPAVVIQSMRKALHDIDPNLPLADVATMEEVRADTFSAVSRPARLIGAFASIALALSAIGLYGVVSYSVTQRRRELGIRIALGARRSEVLWEIVRGALAVVGVGLVFGLAGVFAFTRILRNLLFEVSPLDPLALAVACLAMLLIGLIGSIVPALRAARFDPVLILRDAG